MWIGFVWFCFMRNVRPLGCQGMNAKFPFWCDAIGVSLSSAWCLLPTCHCMKTSLQVSPFPDSSEFCLWFPLFWQREKHIVTILALPNSSHHMETEQPRLCVVTWLQHFCLGVAGTRKFHFTQLCITLGALLRTHQIGPVLRPNLNSIEKSLDSKGSHIGISAPTAECTGAAGAHTYIPNHMLGGLGASLPGQCQFGSFTTCTGLGAEVGGLKWYLINKFSCWVMSVSPPFLSQSIAKWYNMNCTLGHSFAFDIRSPSLTAHVYFEDFLKQMAPLMRAKTVELALSWMPFQGRSFAPWALHGRVPQAP